MTINESEYCNRVAASDVQVLVALRESSQPLEGDVYRVCNNPDVQII